MNKKENRFYLKRINLFLLNFKFKKNANKKFSLHDFAGGTQLSKEEMKNVKGGMAPSGGSGISCSVTNTNTSGVTITYSVTYDSSWTCSSVETLSNPNGISQTADNIQSQNGGRTTFTCPACAGTPVAN